MVSIKNKTDSQLLQALDDAEKEVTRLKAEMKYRLEKRNPKLFQSKKKTFRRFLMERNRVI
jgi:hypothetical protein